MIVERAEARARVLAEAGFAGANESPLPGDASTRRYVRLEKAGRHGMLMDAPPSNETGPCPPDADPATRKRLGYNAEARLAASRVEAFVGVARHLTAHGLSAPLVNAWDRPTGYAVIEDLGDALFYDVVEGGHPEAPPYHAAIEALAHLHAIAAPPALDFDGGAWPLLDYDRIAMLAEVDLMLEWFAGRLMGVALPDEARASWHMAWDKALAPVLAGPRVLVLRDFHAQNLLWLPDRHGPARVGLLDFQDGLAGHPAYDLVSLLEDARRDVSPDTVQSSLAHYIAISGANADEMHAAFAVLGAQRNAKIIGIFARLAIRDGKARYLDLLPRVIAHMRGDIRHARLADVAAWFERWLPHESWDAPASDRVAP
jgi:N-acetylmuramate 1-kinase